MSFEQIRIERTQTVSTKSITATVEKLLMVPTL